MNRRIFAPVFLSLFVLCTTAQSQFYATRRSIIREEEAHFMRIERNHNSRRFEYVSYEGFVMESEDFGCTTLQCIASEPSCRSTVSHQPRPQIMVVPYNNFPGDEGAAQIVNYSPEQYFEPEHQFIPQPRVNQVPIDPILEERATQMPINSPTPQFNDQQRDSVAYDEVENLKLKLAQTEIELLKTKLELLEAQKLSATPTELKGKQEDRKRKNDDAFKSKDKSSEKRKKKGDKLKEKKKEYKNKQK